MMMQHLFLFALLCCVAVTHVSADCPTDATKAVDCKLTGATEAGFSCVFKKRVFDKVAKCSINFDEKALCAKITSLDKGCKTPAAQVDAAVALCTKACYKTTALPSVAKVYNQGGTKKVCCACSADDGNKICATPKDATCAAQANLFNGAITNGEGTGAQTLFQCEDSKSGDSFLGTLLAIVFCVLLFMFVVAYCTRPGFKAFVDAIWACFCQQGGSTQDEGFKPMA